MKIFPIVLIIGLFAAASVYGLVASLGDARMILYANVTAGEVTEFQETLLVENVNEYPIKINIEPDNNYKKIITIIDNDFVLAPGESKRARFMITLQSAGRYDGRLFVSFISEDPEIKGKAGLSSRVIISAKGDVTDHYEEVMGPKETPEDTEQEYTPIDITDDTEKSDTGVITEPEEDRKPTVTTPKEPESDQKPVTVSTAKDTVIGISIIIGIVIIGLVVYFIVRKLTK